MAVAKEHKEFHRLSFDEGWEAIPGYPPGMQHKILSGSLDEVNSRGARTRLMRIPAGVFTTKPFGQGKSVVRKTACKVRPKRLS